MSQFNKESLEYLIAAVATMQAPQVVEGHYPLVTLPRDFKLESLKQFMVNQERIEKHVQLLDIGSFVEYFNKYKTPASKIFLNDYDDKKYLHAIFDYHKEDGTPQHLAHSAKYHFPHSEEWKIWIGNDDEKMKQDEFADFLEENYLDIIQPDHGTMLEIARNIEVRNNVQFESHVRPQSGQVHLMYSEDIRGTVSKGKLEIPESFRVNLRVFNRGTLYPIDARLRFRIVSGALVMWYDLITPHKAIEAAIKEIEDYVNKETGQNLLRGIV